MMHGGLRIFGVGQRRIHAQSKKKPKILRVGAIRIFGKWHGLSTRIKQHRKEFGEYTKEKVLEIMKLVFIYKMKKSHGEETYANKCEKKIVPPEEKLATGSIYQDAGCWFTPCGRPRYPQ